MLCVANLEGYFIEINEAFSITLGYSKDQLLGQPFLSLIHPEDKEATLNELKSLSSGQKTLGFTNRYLHKEGHYRTFSWRSQVDPDNGLVYAVAHDVTEEMNKSLRLHQIEQALTNESIISITDENGVITEVNNKFCEISGYSKDELIGHTHAIVNSGYHSKAFFSDLWRTIASGQVWTGLIKNNKKNGDYYFVQTIITPISDHQGQITHYLAIRHDITEHVKVEEDLAKTLGILNETSAIAKVGGWELEVETGKLTWTDETFRILEVEKVAGHNPNLPEGLKLFIPEHQRLIEEAVNRAIEFGEPYSLELQAQTAKGNVLWVYTNGKANYKDGKIVTLSGTIQDIDARKQAEARYDLERQKSIQTGKLASLGELAASMAHEINNPLGIISGYTELLMFSPNIEQKTHDKLDVILKSCERISHIVGNLKKFSRSEDRMAHQEKSLSSIIHESITLARPRLKRHLVAIEFVGDDAMIDCNEIEIEQVILNLINNAVDAVKTLPERWIKIALLLHEDVVELQVTDSGDGIPESIRQKLFSPFFTTKKAGEGTGLGLSIIKGILKDHNASVDYDGTHTNTCFVIRFPKKRAG